MPSACPLSTSKVWLISLTLSAWEQVDLSERPWFRSTMSLTFPLFSCTALLPLAQGLSCGITMLPLIMPHPFLEDEWLVLKPCAKEDEMVMSCWSTPRCCSNSWHFTCLSDLVTTSRLPQWTLRSANTHNHLMCYTFHLGSQTWDPMQLVPMSIHLSNDALIFACKTLRAFHSEKNQVNCTKIIRQQ
jgi:hypothetical protein